ncbi:MBL fold metallo-hydrolase [Paenarthrobacter sp. PH39-S1]|uniref:MBL fold metallo-hydrolase n=1 Tax=Paenarthrobacter sp. PH39-S1 TaxID=3046204 RepID=UPI0024BADD97|nr:MBL fold metallo-hydrolase [Paenarthrobacter sp. PH39-S1]MDJ0356707.1 MBL fold metallo-hydrolase [Paenarthrobacter sp. PH39-S1]
MLTPNLLEISPSLYRLRIEGGLAHLLNSYIWIDADGVTLIDTGWPDSAQLISDSLSTLDRGHSDVRRVILTHFHDDHSGSAAEIANWGDVEVVAGRDEAAYVTGAEQGPVAVLTAKEKSIAGEVTQPPHGPACRVDHLVDDGDVLDFAGGTRVITTPGHTPGSIALYLPEPSVVLTGDSVAEFGGDVILGVINTDRAEASRSLIRLAETGADVAGFGHGEPCLSEASARIRAAIDPFSDV